MEVVHSNVVRLRRGFGEPAAQAKLDFLKTVHSTLAEMKIDERAIFGEMMFNVFNLAKLSEREMADDMGYNITSVRRWIEGKTTPHKAIWPNVRDWCLFHLAREINELRIKLADSSLAEEKNALASSGR
jgi:hypothetical protein